MHTFPEVADVQNSPDLRNLAVNRVGIRGIRHPAVFEAQPTIATFDMLVDLPKHVKGTHMSRFVEILNEKPTLLDIVAIPGLVQHMVQRLHAKYGFIQAKFPYFIQKQAPISHAKSLMDYDLTLQGILANGQSRVYVTVIVPVTSLCPCSKEIADYGAHNQRSHVTVTVQVTAGFSLTEVIKLIESNASCELYGILKRTDEKAVTERAYDNPKFVEDMVRDIATLLEQIPSIKAYKISSENFESIHNHSAYAEIDKLQVSQEQTHVGVLEEETVV